MLLAGRHAFFLGKYKLLDHLGEGGMGSVLNAEQSPLGRLVAIKTLRKDLVASKNLVARFQREIQAAAALNHPNIVAAYDADSIAGRHFLVMEYVEGRDLGVLIKGGKKLPIGEACEYVRQAALGLQHAHEQQMVHRDIKPSNLMLDSTGRVKILDMGLARIVHTADSQQTELTHTGQVVGTPDYISPEQAHDTRTADIRSDIYSLGCTLYRLLTGKVPSQGDGAVAKITARLVDDPPTLRKALSDAPEELEAVLLKMMMRDVAERYQTPTEVVQALAPFADAATAPTISHETSAAAKQATAPTVAAAVAPELNDFLNQLAVAAALDEEIDTGTQKLEKTQASGGRKSPDANVPTIAYEPATDGGAKPRRSPTISRAGRKLQDEIAARKRADRKRLLIVSSVIVLFVAVVIGLTVWHNAGATHLIVDWPQQELKSATLEVDGRPRSLFKGDHYEYQGRPGSYQLKLTRDGYAPIEMKWTLTRGEKKTFSPDWKPNAETIRQRDLAAIKQRVGKFLNANRGGNPPGQDDPIVVKLRDDLVDFRRQSPGTAAAIEAAKMMSQLPWPVDTLKREDIAPYELKVAGNGDSSNLPAELVAVLGDSRLKHWGAVLSVAVSPDGKQIATGGADASLKLWDIATARVVRTLARSPEDERDWPIYSVAFSSDCKSMVAAGQSNHVEVWDTATGAEQLQLTKSGGGSWIGTVRFSPDGSFIAAVGPTSTDNNEESFTMWEVVTGKEVLSLGSDFEIYASSLAFSPDGRRLATGDVTVFVYGVPAGKQLQRLELPTGIYDLAFSADAQRLVATRIGGMVRVWNAATGKELRDFTAHDGAIEAVAFHPYRRLMATCATDGTVKLWSLEERIEELVSTFQLGPHPRWPTPRHRQRQRHGLRAAVERVVCNGE